MFLSRPRAASFSLGLFCSLLAPSHISADASRLAHVLKSFCGPLTDASRCVRCVLSSPRSAHFPSTQLSFIPSHPSALKQTATMSVTSEKPTIMQQPNATAPMTLTNDAPPAANAGPAGQPRDWSTGVCGCLDGDFGGFCLSCWCPCVGASRLSTCLQPRRSKLKPSSRAVYSQYKSRLDHLKATGRPMPPEQVGASAVLLLVESRSKLILASPETFGTPGVLWLAVNCCAGFAWILDFMARDEIRSTWRSLLQISLSRLDAFHSQSATTSAETA